MKQFPRGTDQIFVELRNSMIRACSSCGKPRDRVNQRYCSGCHATYMRGWRQRRRRRDELANIIQQALNGDL